MRKTYFLLFALLVFGGVLFRPTEVVGQAGRRLTIVSPEVDSLAINDSVAFFRGMADPTGKLFLNGEEIKIYGTHVFAAPMYLQEGVNEFKVAHVLDDDTVLRRLVVVYEKPRRPFPTAGFAIEYIRLSPGGDLSLQPGDLLQVEMKATPGMQATFYRDIPMLEADSTETGVSGIYRGEYILQPSDMLADATLPFSLQDPETKKVVRVESRQRLTVFNQAHVLTGVTTASGVPLYYGLGADRLGGAKMGELDSLVKLEVTGKMNDLYRVRLSEQRQAYIPSDKLHLQQGVHFRPYSLTGSWSVYSDSTDDFVRIGLDERLPYTHTVQQQPTRIVLDIYGAVSNSNWITQKEGLTAIRNVWYEQLNKEVFRVYIELAEQQLWGYEVGYRGNQLVVRVKPKPEVLDISKLTIAVDAGHGGSNRGARGMTGVLEKTLNLSMALALKAALEKAGATVFMTRERDQYVNNGFRLKKFRHVDPDLLISIHCNSSGNPMVQGVSTYYRHQAFRPLSQHILASMRELNLADFGNVGGFNFTLNSPTEFPSVLVEVGFLSNPEDEEKLVNMDFHRDVADRIVEGVKGFLVEQNERYQQDQYARIKR